MRVDVCRLVTHGMTGFAAPLALPNNTI